MDSTKKYLQSKFSDIGIELSELQSNQFLQYYKLLIEKNKVMNLTAITEFEAVVIKHFVDSATLPEEYMKSAKNLIDIGTGAGFPGIPLKILYPDLEILLLDSLNKRIKFLDEVIMELGLKGISTIHGRAEDIAQRKEYREQFDLSVSRAVARLSSLTEYCIPFVKKDGYFISYKAGEIEAEVNDSKKAVHILGGKIENVEELEIPGTDIKRSFIMIKKINTTDKRYPRSAGKPTKEPL